MKHNKEQVSKNVKNHKIEQLNEKKGGPEYESDGDTDIVNINSENESDNNNEYTENEESSSHESDNNEDDKGGEDYSLANDES